MSTTRSRGRAVMGTAVAAVLVAGAGTAAAAPDVRLDFGAPVPGTIADGAGQGTGFTTVLSPAAGTTGIVPGNLLLSSVGGDGVLSVTTTSGDAANPVISNQDNALAVPIDPGVDYAVEARLLGPMGLVQNGQSAGIFIGTDQTNYVKLVARQASGNDGLQLRVEQDNSAAGEQNRGVQSLDLGTDNLLVLRLEVDVSANEVRALFAVNGGALVPVQAQGLPLVAPIVSGPGAVAGIISTHPVSGSAITARYTAFTLDTPPEVTAIAPAAGAQGVPVAGNLTVTFSDAMNPATVGPAVGLARASDGAPIAAAVTLNADGRTATVDPAADLAPSTAYTLGVGVGATDASGYPLVAAAASGFTTASTPPVVTPPPVVRPASLIPGATGLRATWNRATGRLTLRLVGLKGRAAVTVGGRARTARRGVVVLTRRRAGSIVVRVKPKPIAVGVLAPRSWRVVLPARGAVRVRVLAR